jgi:hypothetical protein
VRRLILCLALLVGCGGGAPRKATPPAKRSGLVTERFQIRGVGDTWHEPLPILEGLRGLGGVKKAYVDEATGRYVVVYEPRRTHRDKIRVRVIEIGREQGQHFDPIFDDR